MIPQGLFDDTPIQLHPATSAAIVLCCFEFGDIEKATNVYLKAICKALKLCLYHKLHQAELCVLIASVLHAKGTVSFECIEGRDVGKDDVKAGCLLSSFVVISHPLKNPQILKKSEVQALVSDLHRDFPKLVKMQPTSIAPADKSCGEYKEE